MTKSELIEKPAQTEGVTREAEERAVTVAFESMARALSREDGRVMTRHLGLTCVRMRWSWEQESTGEDTGP